MTWTYVSDSGQQYVVGLFHSVQEGHFMVYVNQKVVLIDFQVFATKTYPLFLEDELFEIEVERRNGQYYYGFSMDREADTPRNRARKVMERLHWKQTLIFIGALAIGVAAILALGKRLAPEKGPDEEELALLLDLEGRADSGRIEAVYQHEGFMAIRYAFGPDGQTRQGRTMVEGADAPILPNGLRLSPGDRFEVRYLPNNPGLNQLDIHSPTPAQLQQYKLQALAKQMLAHPGQTKAYAQCLVQQAYETEGLQGLAAVLEQETDVSENPWANSQRYLRLLRSPDFRKRLDERCW